MKRIVIASVLKPVDDTRMFEKIGRSLSDAGYDVHVCGFPTTAKNQSRISWHPLPHFHRIGWSRLSAPLMLFRKIKSLRPALLIITTHELLFVGLLLKMLTGCKIIYDVQENHYRNIRYGSAFPKIFRAILGGYVRLKERLTAPWIDHFFLAEISYVDELTFTHSYSILENKAERPEFVNTSRGKKKLLFSGTLADTTGVFTAINLATQLHDIDKEITLTIIGFAAQEETRRRMDEVVSGKPFIKLIGINTLVPHSLIIDEIDNADFGIISYPPNASTSGATPTKLYEYLAHQLPFLLINHTPWVTLAYRFNAAVIFDENRAPVDIYKEMSSRNFYGNDIAPPTWANEVPALFAALQKLGL